MSFSPFRLRFDFAYQRKTNGNEISVGPQRAIQELQQQADALKKQADELRNLERAGVIEELKAEVSEYGLTAGDLRLGSSIKATKRASGSKSAAKAAPKYRSSNGEEWSGGRGRKPRWVTEALAAGKGLAEFEIK